MKGGAGLKKVTKVILTTSCFLLLCCNFTVIKYQQSKIDDLGDKLITLKKTVKKDQLKIENEINKLKKLIKKKTK